MKNFNFITNKDNLSLLAKNILNKIQDASEKAFITIKNLKTSNNFSIGESNTDLAIKIQSNLNKIDSDKYRNLIGVTNEPVIARILVQYEKDDKFEVFYISRFSNYTDISDLVNYKAPIGRLAALPIGDDIVLPNGKIVEVVEKATFKPVKEIEWDALNTILENDKINVITLTSLIKVTKSNKNIESQDKDILKKLLAQEEENINITEGIKRQVINKISLRDQPILDKVQDEIFRMPLDRRLLILGPPGTGKTTTLIKRIGQKIDIDLLSQKEKKDIKKIKESSIFNKGIETDWIMFTPTRLLKMYIKEAFAKEQVPASDKQIFTWQDFSFDIARNTLKILRTAASTRGYVLTESETHLTKIFINKQRDFFNSFFNFHTNRVYFQLYLSPKILNDLDIDVLTNSLAEKNEQIDIKEKFIKINSLFESYEKKEISFFSLLESIELESKIIKSFSKKIYSVIYGEAEKSLTYQCNNDISLLDKIVEFLRDDFKDKFNVKIKTIEEEDEDEDEEEEGLDENILEEDLRYIGKKKAISEYIKACIQLSYKKSNNEKIEKNSKLGRFTAFLNNRLPDENTLKTIGKLETIRRQLNKVSSPIKKYFQDINKNYKYFRIDCIDEKNEWFSKNIENVKENRVSALELDSIILLNLLISYQILNSNKLNVNLQVDREWSFLENIFSTYRAQVYVDEASDFSPVQLKCMAALSYPDIGSFFASGDLNQSLTRWGIKNRNDLQWIAKNLEIKEISNTYRQTKQLCKFAEELINIGKSDRIPPILPKNIDNEGVPPVLLEKYNTDKDLCFWMADRIIEIEKLTTFLPSIAIFVENEDLVFQIANILKSRLSENNIAVEACPGGEIVGQNIHVRVFDIKHIKGLEFEAVFLAGISNAEDKDMEIFSKYLYVGATRAATYLGIAIKDNITEEYNQIKAYCNKDWNEFLAL